MIAQSLQHLKEMQHPTGLFSASKKDVKTGYNLSWIRDNIYATLGFEAVKNMAAVRKAYHAILDILLKHEYKIDWIISKMMQLALSFSRLASLKQRERK
jgi:GH15 family glucan-1,4-alpha-glucosidase